MYGCSGGVGGGDGGTPYRLAPNTHFFSSIRMWVSGTVGNMELILATVRSVSAAVTFVVNVVSTMPWRPSPIRGLDRTIGDISCVVVVR